MRPIDIAMADIVQGDRHLLQLRNHDPNKPAAGLIGFFGGQREAGETYKQAVKRELHEETTLIIDENRLRVVGSFTTTMQHDGKSLQIIGRCYRVEVPTDTDVKAKEGEIVTMTTTDLAERTAEMSPATKAVITKYYT